MNEKDPFGVGYGLALFFASLHYWFIVFVLCWFVLTSFTFVEWLAFVNFVWYAGFWFTWFTFLFNYKRFRRATRAQINDIVVKHKHWFSDIFILFFAMSFVWPFVLEVNYADD